MSIVKTFTCSHSNKQPFALKFNYYYNHSKYFRSCLFILSVVYVILVCVCVFFLRVCRFFNCVMADILNGYDRHCVAVFIVIQMLHIFHRSHALLSLLFSLFFPPPIFSVHLFSKFMNW